MTWALGQTLPSPDGHLLMNPSGTRFLLRNGNGHNPNTVGEVVAGNIVFGPSFVEGFSESITYLDWLSDDILLIGSGGFSAKPRTVEVWKVSGSPPTATKVDQISSTTSVGSFIPLCQWHSNRVVLQQGVTGPKPVDFQLAHVDPVTGVVLDGPTALTAMTAQQPDNSGGGNYHRVTGDAWAYDFAGDGVAWYLLELSLETIALHPAAVDGSYPAGPEGSLFVIPSGTNPPLKLMTVGPLVGGVRTVTTVDTGYIWQTGVIDNSSASRAYTLMADLTTVIVLEARADADATTDLTWLRTFPVGSPQLEDVTEFKAGHDAYWLGDQLAMTPAGDLLISHYSPQTLDLWKWLYAVPNLTGANKPGRRTFNL